jgi:hypothetical protein
MAHLIYEKIISENPTSSKAFKDIKEHEVMTLSVSINPNVTSLHCKKVYFVIGIR